MNRFRKRRGNAAYARRPDRGRLLQLCVVPLVLARPPFIAGSAQEFQPATAPAHLADGRRALEARDLRRAKAQFELAVKADPKSVEAFITLGIVELQSGENATAVGHFQQAINLQPGSFGAHYNLALCYLREKNWDQGRRELERAVALDPRSADAAYNLGVVLLEQGRPNAAIPRLRQALRLDPRRPDAAFNLVRAEIEETSAYEARREAKDEAKTFGADADWRASVGRLFFEHGMWREAAEHLREASRLRPGSAEIRRQLAAALIEGQDAAQALTVLEAVPEEGRGPEDHYWLASAYYQSRRLPEAERQSRLDLTAKPLEPRYLLLQARIDQRLGHHAEALELLGKASLLASKWAEPYYSAGVSYYMLRRYADARQSLATALALDAHSARVLFLYSATLVNEGKNREAEPYLRRAIALDPANARFQYHLGALLVRDNRPGEAHTAFEKAIQLKPDYGPPHYQLGKLLARSDGREAAELAARELELAVRAQPDLAQAYYHLSRVYVRLGEKQRAESALATFHQLKSQEKEESQQLVEDVKKELER